MKLTENDFARIVELGRQGLNCADIANAIGAHQGTVWTVNKRLGLGVPKGSPGGKSTWTPEDDAKLRKLMGDGLTIKAAAERLGRSTPSTWERCDKLGIKGGLTFVRWTEADEDRVFALWQGGMRACDIAKATGIDDARVRRKIKRWRP